MGLRPYRPAGFVVRAEPLGAKHVIHNYGHGGAGITLSWGTSQLAVDLAMPVAGVRCAVIGCGVIGLSTAILLQRRGAPVTIYAKALPPDTTSNIAGGHWSPVSVYDRAVATPEYLDQHARALRIAYRSFQLLVGSRYGVRWHRNFILHEQETPFGPMAESLRDVLPGMALLAPGEHPFGAAHVQFFQSMMIEPNAYLRALMDDFQLAGGRIVVRDFASREEVASLGEPLVFNCTGLGARALFGDEDLIPVRGQLVVLLPQPELDYNTFREGALPFYMFPRSDGVVLGGTFERRNWSLEPSEETTARIVEGNAVSMRWLQR